MINKQREYRRRARECLDLARSASLDIEDKLRLVAIAQAWLELTKNRDAGGEDEGPDEPMHH